MKIHAKVEIDFVAPDDTDAWDLVRGAITTHVLVSLGDRGCRNIRPEIIKIVADGLEVKWNPKRRPTQRAK